RPCESCTAMHHDEHEQEEQRRQDQLLEEYRKLPPGDVDFAAQDGAERGGLAHRSALPMRWMNTSSSVGAPKLTSLSGSPWRCSTAAAGATSGGASPDRYSRTCSAPPSS